MGLQQTFLVNCWKWAKKTVTGRHYRAVRSPQRGRHVIHHVSRVGLSQCSTSWKSRWCHIAWVQGRLQSTQLDGDQQQEEQRGGSVSQQQSLPPSHWKCLCLKRKLLFSSFLLPSFSIGQRKLHVSVKRGGKEDREYTLFKNGIEMVSWFSWQALHELPH